MKKTLTIFTIILAASLFVGTAHGKSPRAKFYDFQNQLIDGEIKQPTALYTDSRQQVKFGRLLSLKKSFTPRLLETSKERLFK